MKQFRSNKLGKPYYQINNEVYQAWFYPNWSTNKDLPTTFTLHTTWSQLLDSCEQTVGRKVLMQAKKLRRLGCERLRLEALIPYWFTHHLWLGIYDFCVAHFVTLGVMTHCVMNVFIFSELTSIFDDIFTIAHLLIVFCDGMNKLWCFWFLPCVWPVHLLFLPHTSTMLTSFFFLSCKLAYNIEPGYGTKVYGLCYALIVI